MRRPANRGPASRFCQSSAFFPPERHLLPGDMGLPFSPPCSASEIISLIPYYREQWNVFQPSPFSFLVSRLAFHLHCAAWLLGEAFFVFRFFFPVQVLSIFVAGFFSFASLAAPDWPFFRLFFPRLSGLVFFAFLSWFSRRLRPFATLVVSACPLGFFPPFFLQPTRPVNIFPSQTWQLFPRSSTAYVLPPPRAP